MGIYAEQLASVNASIAALEAQLAQPDAVQETSFADGSRVRYFDGAGRAQMLAALYAQRTQLMPLAAREARGGRMSFGYGVPI